MKKKILALCLAASMTAALTACGSPSGSTSGTTGAADNDTSAGAVGGGTLSAATQETHAADTTVYNIAAAIEPTTLDVHKTNALAARSVGRYIYEALVDFDKDYNIKPQLCTSYDVNDDNTVYTFHLREGVKFHNGEEMTADDVVASMNRWIENCGTASSVLDVEKDRFEKIDDYTVEIKLSAPALLFCQVMAGSKWYPAIMPESVVEKETETGVSEYIGTGPLKLEEWKENSYLKFSKFEDYVGNGMESSGMVGNKVMNFETVMYYIVPDETTRLFGVKTGEYDIASIGLDSLDDALSDPTLTSSTSFGGEMFLMMNDKSGVCADENFRKAVSAAISLDDVMYAAYPNDDYYRISKGLMAQENTVWFNESGSEYLESYDVEKAKEYLKASSYNGETVRLMTTEAYPTFYNATLAIESYLNAIGVKTQVDVYDWSTMVSYTVDDTMFDMYVVYYSPVGTPFELSYLSPTSTGWTDIAAVNEGRAQMNACATIDEAAALWSGVQSAFFEKCPQIKMGDFFSCWINKSYLKGDVFNFGELTVPWEITKE